MIENNAQLVAALFQMESLADTLEGMRRHALDTEASVFAATSGDFVTVLRERIAEVCAYVQILPETPNGTARADLIRGLKRQIPQRNLPPDY